MNNTLEKRPKSVCTFCLFATQGVIIFLFLSQVPSKDGRFNFSLNICGPLVPTDVPLSGCNPQGVCGQAGGAEAHQGKEHQRISFFRF
jgi:hypothetical protein